MNLSKSKERSSTGHKSPSDGKGKSLHTPTPSGKAPKEKSVREKSNKSRDNSQQNKRRKTSKSPSPRGRSKISNQIEEQKRNEQQKIIEQLLSSNKWNQPHKRPDSLNLKDYRKFMKNKRMSVNLAYWLLQFYAAVVNSGGIIQSISRNFFNQIVSRFCERNYLSNNDPGAYFLLHKHYLLAYEMHKTHKMSPSQVVNLGYMTYYNVGTYKKLRESGKLPQDVFMIENFCEECKLDPNILSPQFLREKYGSDLIEIRKQMPDAHGFNPQQLLIEKDKMLISEYVEYQASYGKLEDDKKGKVGKKRPTDKTVKFAVNIDTLDKPQIRDEISKKLVEFKQFQFVGILDGLSYLDVQIPGCSLPQIYLKVKGCWTGGHQQNTSLSALNINHGPDQSQWLTLDQEYVPRLREQVLKEFKRDIIKDEGLWFEDIFWFIKNNYPIKKIIQKKGDVVCSGPGTMHWVRALGTSMQTAWNIMPKTMEQLKISRIRQVINEEIKFQIVIPFKSLVLKILNHEYHKNPHTRLMEEYILTWLEDEQLALGQYQLLNPNTSFNWLSLQDSATSCFKCYTEIVLYYIFENRTVYCLRCAMHYKVKSRNIQSKYEKVNVFDLIHRSRDFRLNNVLDDVPEVEGLCDGKFIGEVSYCHVAKNNGRMIQPPKAPEQIVFQQAKIKQKETQNSLLNAVIKEIQPSINENKKDNEQHLAEKKNEQKTHEDNKDNSNSLKSKAKKQTPKATPKSRSGEKKPQKQISDEKSLQNKKQKSLENKSKQKSKSRSRQRNRSNWSQEFNNNKKDAVRYPRRPTNIETLPTISLPSIITNMQFVSEVNPPTEQKIPSKVLYPRRTRAGSKASKTVSEQVADNHQKHQKQAVQQKLAQNRIAKPAPIEQRTPNTTGNKVFVKYPRKTAVSNSVTPEKSDFQGRYKN